MNNINPTERLHGLDAVRAIALLLGVVLHATMSFLPGMQIWITVDSSRSPALSVLFYGLHMFRMITFFWIAGFFASLSFERLGLRKFILDRLKRIVLPLTLAWLPVIASITAIATWSATIANGGIRPPTMATPALSPSNFPLAHLWFLYLLILFYIVFLGIQQINKNNWLSRVSTPLVKFLLSWFGTVFVALPMVLVLYFNPTWYWWFGVPTPDTGLQPNITAVIIYGYAFALGCMVQQQASLLKNLEQRWVFHLVVALFSTVSSLWMVGISPVFTIAPLGTPKLLYAFLYSLAAWNWVFALLGFALRYLANFNPLRRYIADASYWIYLVHLPLVMALQTLVSGLEFSWIIKFPSIVLIAFVVLFSSYHLLVRNTWFGVILNGKRIK